MSTRELKKAYVQAIRDRLEPLGFTYTKEAFSTRVECGSGYVLPIIAATYGRLTTTLNVGLVHDQFETVLWSVLDGIERQALPEFTSHANVSDLRRGGFLSLDMEVHANDDIGRVVELIDDGVRTAARPFWESLNSLEAVCLADNHMALERVPLALYLRGEDDEVDEILSEWAAQDDRMRAIAGAYRSNLHEVQPMRFASGSRSTDGGR